MTEKKFFTEARTILFLIYRNQNNIKETTYFMQTFSDLIDGAERECARNGYKLEVEYLDRQAIEMKVEMLSHEDQGGILLLATEMTDDQIELFLNLNLPLVVLDHPLNELKKDNIIMDNERGIKEALKYLRAQHHKKIGYLHVVNEITNLKERFECFCRFGRELNFQISEDNVIQMSGCLSDELYWELMERFQKIQEMPTAFLMDNDVIAICAMKVLRELGYDLPEEISLIGFDDIELARKVEPPLTTIYSSRYEMGVKGVNKLLFLISGKTEPKEQIRLKTFLIIRESVANLEET